MKTFILGILLGSLFLSPLAAADYHKWAREADLAFAQISLSPSIDGQVQAVESLRHLIVLLAADNNDEMLTYTNREAVAPLLRGISSLLLTEDLTAKVRTLKNEIDSFLLTRAFSRAENLELFRAFKAQNQKAKPPALSRHTNDLVNRLRKKLVGKTFPFGDLEELLMQYDMSQTQRIVRAFKATLVRAADLNAEEKSFAWEGFASLVTKFHSRFGHWKNAGYQSVDGSFLYYGKSHYLAIDPKGRIWTQKRNSFLTAAECNLFSAPERDRPLDFSQFRLHIEPDQIRLAKEVVLDPSENPGVRLGANKTLNSILRGNYWELNAGQIEESRAAVDEIRERCADELARLRLY